MSQVSYGTITITDTTDLTTYIRYATKVPLTAASQFQETPTTDTHYIAVLSIPASDPTPAWNSSSWKWLEFIGTDGVSVLGTREIYYLKTNSATVAAPANGSDISQASANVENQWTKSVPTYVVNGEYWTCIQTHLDGSPTWVYGSPVLNQSLTDMNHDIDVMKSITQQSVEDSQGALSIATGINQHFFSIPNDYSASVPAGSYITEINVDEFKQSPSGGNLLTRSDGVWLRNGADILASLQGTGLTFLIPTGTYKGRKSLEISGGTIPALKLYDAQNDNAVATFGLYTTMNDQGTTSYKNGVQIGKFANSHIDIDYHSMQMIDRNGNNYLYVSDLRDETGFATIEEKLTSGSAEQDAFYRMYFSLQLNISEIISVSVNGDDWTSKASINGTSQIKLSEETPALAEVIIVYTTTSSAAKAYTFGKRSSNYFVGPMSFAEGSSTGAEGYASHAEGVNSVAKDWGCHVEGHSTEAKNTGSHAEGIDTHARGTSSHAEGYSTLASGSYSHAQNYYTRAQYKSQTAIGTFNDNKPDTILEIGNGKAQAARSNAFIVDWDGNVMAQGFAGMIQMFAGAVTQTVTNGVATTTGAPAGWLLCDGSILYISEYPKLAAVLGSNYGGNGTTTFALPDLRGRFPLGVSASHPLKGVGQGESGGSENATLVSHSHGPGSLTMDEKGGHAHKIRLNDVGASGNARNIPVSSAALSTNTFTDTVGSHKHTISGSTETKGSSAAGANMPPYRTVNFIIATGKTS